MAKTFNQYEKNILLYWLEQREKSSVAAKWFSAENQFFFGLLDLWKGLFVALEMRGWCHSCQLLHHSWRWKVQGEEKCFSTENQFFLAFLTFEKALLWLSRWGGGVTRANFCITRGSLSWLVAPRDAKVGTRDTTPSPLEPQQSLFKGLEGQKELIFSGKTFFLTLDFSSPLMMQKFALVTPPPQLSCHKKAFSKVLKAKKNWFSAENHFALPQTFHVALTNIVKY